MYLYCNIRYLISFEILNAKKRNETGAGWKTDSYIQNLSLRSLMHNNGWHTVKNLKEIYYYI